MTPLLFVAVAVAGGVGAMARFSIDSAITSRGARGLPWGTILINVTGSLALGVVVGLVVGGLLPPEWQAVLGVGFLGGYTTFSTASYETVRLLQQRRYALAAVNGLGVLVVCAVLAALGLWVGSTVAAALTA